MKLVLSGHDDRYAVEQLQLALFPDGTEGQAVSTLHRGRQWLTATAKITLDGKTATAQKRIKAADETVRGRRRALQWAHRLHRRGEGRQRILRHKGDDHCGGCGHGADPAH